MAKAIGIDLGTTNSCAAHVENGQPKVILQPGGTNILPSIFSIDAQGNQLIGSEAKRQAQLNPQDTVSATKRLIGRNFHSKTVSNIRQLFTYEMVEGKNEEVLIKIRDKLLTLEQISGAIIDRIRRTAEESLQQPIHSAVVTVPAYFNERQRQAVRNAGKIADLEVLRIINEPTAAALAHGVKRGTGKRIAVYDLGGGTFDISIIDIHNSVFEVIATGGDTFLGGVDFDDRLMQHPLEQFLERYDQDLSFDRVAVQRIRDAAEEAKIRLSSIEKTQIYLPYITNVDGKSLNLDTEVSRETLERLTEDLVDRTIKTCAKIVEEAKTTIDKLDAVLLVGGQSRMPLVQKKLHKFLGKLPSKSVHPDEAVALGAAIMAHSLTADTGTKVTLLDVLPMAIGLKKGDGSMHVLFPKNSPLPASKRCTISTFKDNQESLMIRLFQGESSQVKNNELLGAYVFTRLRQAPKAQVKLEIRFDVNAEGLLDVSAKDKTSNKPVEIRSHTLTKPFRKTRSKPDGQMREAKRDPKRDLRSHPKSAVQSPPAQTKTGSPSPAPPHSATTKPAVRSIQPTPPQTAGQPMAISTPRPVPQTAAKPIISSARKEESPVFIREPDFTSLYQKPTMIRKLKSWFWGIFG